MNEKEVRERAFAMPLTSPAYPPGPYRFVNREFFIVAYRTDPEKLKAVIPAPLEFTEAIVKYEFIRMPDSTGFGDYTESGQVIPVSFRGEKGGYVHSMYLDCDPPIAGGRELWGFPKKLASPVLKVEKDTLGGVLRFGPVPVADGTLLIRPEAISPKGSLHIGLCKVEDVAFFGPHVRAHVTPLTAPDLALVVHLPQSEAVEPGGVLDLGAEAHVVLRE